MSRKGEKNEKSPSNPGGLSGKVSTLEVEQAKQGVRIGAIEEYIEKLDRLLLDPKEGLFAQVKDIRNTIGFWPKLIGVVVTFIGIMIGLAELVELLSLVGR